MIGVRPDNDIAVLEERLTRGAELLFDMEQRGEQGEDYLRWLRHYEDLIVQYERLAPQYDAVAA